ncbi:MAG: hypothetical protein R3272_14520, partial [Candidatus Promineifilaceae bacterium]|nr:hypothetical protein [Candidatus Promineifilaceae bacterium]
MGHDLRVQRLHLRASAPAGAALRPQLAQALGAATLAAGRLPPSAILIVRRLDDLPPFPRRAAERRRWQRQVARRLNQLTAAAQRPARGPLPATAAAVLFADEVELLHCYTRDLLAGRSPWYWQELFPPGPLLPPLPERLLTAWVRYARALPATLSALPPHVAQRALSLLAVPDLRCLLSSLHEVYSLPDDILRLGVPPAASAAHPLPPVSPRRAPETSAAPPPFASPAAAVYGGLSWQAAYIAGLCHTLAHHPQWARDERFAPWLAQIIERAQDARGAPAVAHAETIGRRERTPTQAPTERDTAIDVAMPEPGTAAPSAACESARLATDRTPASQAGLAIAEAGDTTALGGAFYLVNLLSTLGLPGDCPGLELLNPWELLAALAASLLGEQYERYQDDPLWRLLHALAGRPADDPVWGATLPPPPPHFLLPPALLTRARLSTLEATLVSPADGMLALHVGDR